MQPDQTPPVSPRKIRLYGTVAIGVLAAVVVTGIITRSSGDAQLREWTDLQAVPSVAVTLPGTKPLNATLDLPGRLEAYSRAPIFARVSGYLKSWSVDIGAQVTAGQKLAEIEAPDLDQQLLQARADLMNTQAAARLSAATLARRKTLLASNFVSQQEIDERSADLASRRPRSTRCRPTSSGLRPWRATRMSPRRSTASSPNATPTSARSSTAAPARGLRCSWCPTSRNCVFMSTCRKAISPASGWAPRPRSRCRNMRVGPSRRASKRRRSRSMCRQAPRACSLRSRTRRVSFAPERLPTSSWR